MNFLKFRFKCDAYYHESCRRAYTHHIPTDEDYGTQKKNYRRTNGTSESFCSGAPNQPFQGGMQRNGAIGPIIILFAIFLVQYLYSKKWIFIYYLVFSMMNPL